MNAEAYQKRVNELLPRSRTGLQCLKAFSAGGGICCLGQLIQDLGRTYLDLDKEQAGTVCSLCLIFLAGLLTALGVFDRIASFAGAGTVVPITGFANSVVAPAIEFRSEGLVTGTAAKLFQIAGPVLVYGIGSSVVYGIILFFIGIY
jgi:stage V sporulation protein AC